MEHGNINSEDYFLGCLVKDYAFVVKLCTTIGFKGEYLEAATSKAIWQASETLYAQGKPVDAASVVETIDRDFKHIDTTGASNLLAKAMVLANNPHSAMFHMKVIKEKFRRRHAIDLLTGGIDSLADNEDVDNVVSSVKHKLTVAEQEMAVSSESVSDKRDRIRERYTGVRSKGSSGVKSRWPLLQSILGGYTSGKLIVVGARPKMGKSTLALNEVINTSYALNIPSAFFSIEMDEEELLEKAASDVTEMDNFKLKLGEYSEDQIDEFMDHGIDGVMNTPLEIIDEPSMTIERICTKVRELSAEKGIKLAVVDYLQIISSTPGTRFQSRTYEIAHWLNQLRIVAKETGVSLIVLSQISRPPKGMSFNDMKNASASSIPFPTMSDLKDSGSIEQDAYAIVLLGATQASNIPPSWQGVEPVCVRVEANRGGKVGDIEMMFNKPCNKFMSFSEYEQYRKGIYATKNSNA